MGYNSYIAEIQSLANPLRSESDLNPLIDSIKDKKVVMLGESSHGTQEFYEWRCKITKELIENHGFDFIAVEGDWPATQEVNRYLRHENSLESYQVLSSFNRWPTWMWANTEIQHFIEWLREKNAGATNLVGFHGLDVYSLFESMGEVIKILEKIDRPLAERAAHYYSCFGPYRNDEKEYARSLFHIPEGCKQEALAVLDELLRMRLEGSEDNLRSILDARQNAEIVKNAENYYRAMVFGEEDSWNVRDHHMMSTLNSLFDQYGHEAKGIVWAHNTHIGDYRATDMIIRDEINIGGLAREAYGKENVSLVGFSTYQGSVIASHSWDGPTEIKHVPPGRAGSVEEEFHRASKHMQMNDYFVLLNKSEYGSHLLDMRGHRAIGVIYYPEAESRGNYVPTSLANRYDAFIFLNETTALTPLRVSFSHQKFPETYPYGNKF